MKKLFLLPLILIFTLNACISEKPSPPTATILPTSISTSTLTITATKTIEPTPEIKEHGEMLVEFEGMVDFNISKKVNIEIEDGFFIRRWTPVTLENDEIVAVVTFQENPKLESLFTLISSTGSSSLNRQLTDQEIDEIYLMGLKAGSLDTLGTLKTIFFTGNTSEQILLYKNPFEGILEGNLADRMITFAETLDVSVLPIFNDIPYPIVFSYRIGWSDNP